MQQEYLPIVRFAFRLLARKPGTTLQIHNTKRCYHGNTLRCNTSFVPRAQLFQKSHQMGRSSRCIMSPFQNTMSTSASPQDATYEVTISNEKNFIELFDQNGNKLKFHSTWLRYNCHCSDCRQTSSGQITLDIPGMKPKYSIKSAQMKGKEIIIEMENDNHIVKIPVQHLLDNDYSEETRCRKYAEATPNVVRGKVPEVTYEEIEESSHGLLKWLSQLNDVGICLLKGVPTEDGMVGKMAEKIWTIQETIYGKLFDVISTPSPINIAYSTAALGFHTDLAYYESAPGIQMLHCLRFDECVAGGESVFVDGWAVAEELGRRHPAHFRTLTTVPATFQKVHFDRDRPVRMIYRRPHISLGLHGHIVAVHWSPPFEGPLCVSEELVEPYYEAYNVFAKMLEESDSKLELQLEAGDLISFNNRRNLHARNAFELNGGVRHLQGCYLNIDEFKSQTAVYKQKLGDSSPLKRVMNHCLL